MSMPGVGLFPFQKQCVNEVEWFDGRCLNPYSFLPTPIV